MEINEVPPASTGSGSTEAHAPISRATAIVLTCGFELVAVAALIVAFWTSLCSLFGETCTDAEQTRVSLMIGAGLALGVGGPVLIAWLRRAAVWALTPLIIVAAGLVMWGADIIFDL